MEGRSLFFKALLLGEFGELCEVLNVAFLEERIGEHFAQGRREAHGQTESNAVVGEASHHAKQRNIGLGHGFVEPILFEEIWVFWVANKGKMRMQDDAEVAL